MYSLLVYLFWKQTVKMKESTIKNYAQTSDINQTELENWNAWHPPI